MDLSTPAALASLARDVAVLLGAERIEQDGTPDRARIVYADGRTLALALNRPGPGSPSPRHCPSRPSSTAWRLRPSR